MTIDQITSCSSCPYLVREKVVRIIHNLDFIYFDRKTDKKN